MKSRAIWDRSRLPEASLADKIAPFLYESGLTELWAALSYDSLKRCALLVVKFVEELKGLWETHRRKILRLLRRLRRHWKLLFAVAGYFFVVAQLHLRFECGQMILIFTSLALIYTYGFDKSDDNNNKVSAYSVFNGFRNILGSIDAEELGRQYAGGAMAALHQPQQQHEQEEDEEAEDNGNPDINAVDNALPQPRHRAGRGKKKQKGRRDEIEARRERQFQQQLAREHQF